MTVKTDYARFDIHDELTAPAGSERLLKSISTAGGTVSKLVGVLAGSPASLKAFARLRSELHAGALPADDRDPDRPRGRRAPRRRLQRRPARPLGPAQRHSGSTRSPSPGASSGDPKEAALLAFVEGTMDSDGHPPLYLLEEAREVDWTDEQLHRGARRGRPQRVPEPRRQRRRPPAGPDRRVGPALRGLTSRSDSMRRAAPGAAFVVQGSGPDDRRADVATSRSFRSFSAAAQVRSQRTPSV